MVEINSLVRKIKPSGNTQGYVSLKLLPMSTDMYTIKILYLLKRMTHENRKIINFLCFIVPHSHARQYIQLLFLYNFVRPRTPDF